ncbi:MGH1-like glycoside hydrolase domain-containing protein [Rhodohalobacter sp. 8-1]|uniref:MGH1-like glycoside hydrolase domain-containing protein n=1 Tax=Rhodohalobacter sp. 8-1 TaxID=3131972 RepID=UPI0030ECB6F4
MSQSTESQSPPGLTDHIKEAKKVLEQNRVGSFTKPAANLYPYQWSWDSAFIAIGYAHYAQHQAEKELLHLFRSQWQNGLVPQIVFANEVKKGTYFPGPDFWQTEDVEAAPDSPRTSGICQPPIHATAVMHVLKYGDDYERAKRFAAEIFPKLKAWHEFLHRERDPENEGLVYIRHPWGSGQDNSPIWDAVLQNLEISPEQVPPYSRKDTDLIHIDERPSDDDYDKYVYLLDFFRQRKYDEERIRKDGCPFLIQDVLFNSLLCKADRDLAEIANAIGEKSKPFTEQADRTARTINDKLWDDEHDMYLDFDLNEKQRVRADVLSGFIPMFAEIPGQDRANRMFNYLNTHCFCRLDDDCLAAPSYDRSGPGYSASKYWRGPIWINMNWMLSEGLQAYGNKEYVTLIRNSIAKLTLKNGFCEYFNPESGEGHGSDCFSWTSSLLIDIATRYDVETLED